MIDYKHLLHNSNLVLTIHIPMFSKLVSSLETPHSKKLTIYLGQYSKFEDTDMIKRQREQANNQWYFVDKYQ